MSLRTVRTWLVSLTLSAYPKPPGPVPQVASNEPSVSVCQPAVGALVPLCQFQVSRWLIKAVGGGGGEPICTVSTPAASVFIEPLITKPKITRGKQQKFILIEL